VQRDGLGSPRAVRLVDGRLVFSGPGDRRWCYGEWRVTAIGQNGSAKSVTITIPAVDPADGARAA
jgi:hypothetical protein